MTIIEKVAREIAEARNGKQLIESVLDTVQKTFLCRSSRILIDLLEFESEEFVFTKYCLSEQIVMQDNSKLTLEIYFDTQTEIDEFTEKKSLPILVSLLSAGLSQYQLRLVMEENVERMKELDGINEVSSIIGREISIKETLSKIAKKLGKSMQYPEHTSVRIAYEDVVYESKRFKESAWFIKEQFVTLDNRKGSIQIFYTKKFPDADDGPFLKEEIRMLSNISRLICGYINNHKGRRVINETNRLVDSRKPVDFRKALMKENAELQRFFNKQALDKYIYLDMMRYKVKNILFVSTLYDAFILENEDSFFERFMGEIYQYSLFSLPRITGVTSGTQAMEVLKTKHFDLVIIMVGLDKKKPVEISRNIRQKYRKLPIYMMVNQKTDVKHFEELIPTTSSIDKLFVWDGNSQVLFAIVKSIEDAANVENDTAIGLVRVILLIEDNTIYYSRYLQYLYSIVFGQVQQLLSEDERNEINKIQKMRSRPKIIHARNYEEAMFIYEKYKDFILCVISDVEFDRNGTLDKEAGLRFIRHVKKQTGPFDLPIILQSADVKNEMEAKKLGVSFFNKHSDQLFAELKNFLVSKLWFGNFVFRDKQGQPIAEARTLKEFQTILEKVPERSLKMHAEENQFSLWLMSRGEIQLAKTLNPIQVSDFDCVEDFRKKVLETIVTYKEDKRRGKIVDFDEISMIDEKNIVSLSGGSIGGKGRGLAFINALIYNLDFSKFSKEINIRTPKTAIIGTDEFDFFMNSNNLFDVVSAPQTTYQTIRKAFYEAHLSDGLRTKLIRLLNQLKGPLAVRSSSLSEDNINQPFAGVFDTYVVPNNDSDIQKRLEHLEQTIKLVFASIYSDESKHYFDAIHRKVEDEKMAIVLQELVGSQYDHYYYPHIAGTAQSYNYYPVAHMRPEEGFAMAAVGLGYYVVGGQKSFRFSPKYPTVEVYSTQDMVRMTQTEFVVVDLDKTDLDYLGQGESAPLATLPISEGEKHGSIKHLASVYNPQNDQIEAGLSAYGPRVINFANILKYDYVPLARLLDEILQIAQGALGSPVELEWAVDLNAKNNGLPSFYLLQIKPMVAGHQSKEIKIEQPNKDNTLLYAEKSLGNGELTDIFDIIYVDPEKFDKMQTLSMVKEIEYLNNVMMNEDRKYILIGPGRWGTRDRFLGIPVTWPQISNAKMIVEMSLPDFPLDSSLGSHFFHNVTSMNIGYCSVQDSSMIDFINWDWIKNQKVKTETEFFRHIRLKKSLVIKMNGKERKSIVLYK